MNRCILHLVLNASGITVALFQSAMPKSMSGVVSLHTSDISMAKQKAAVISGQLEQEWEEALTLGKHPASS